MIRLYKKGAYVFQGKYTVSEEAIENEYGRFTAVLPEKKEAKTHTLAYQILNAHNQSAEMEQLQIRFDKLISHDITYVGIIQTARASGLERFPVPYVLTNCHNSLCAVGGTINEDDHMFGLSCAKKYGGVYVPPHQAVIHQYAREMLAGGGQMILGSDSHTRYGALGTMAIGEGGPELVKQLLQKTYDIKMPEVVGVHLTGTPRHGVGPQDIALSIIGAVFANGYVNNKVMEFFGEGVKNLTVEERIGVDVMTTETTCLSSIWITDDKVKEFYGIHGRKEDYKELTLPETVFYDGMIEVDLTEIKPMIAMPFHPSNVYTIDEVTANPEDVLYEVEKKAESSLDGNITFALRDKIHNGKLYVDQGVIAGCAGGGFENICAASDILQGRYIGNGEFSLSIYPASQPIFMELVRNGTAAALMQSGAIMRTAFCGPCFGAGDVPANRGLSIRHSTRNFPYREGSKITNGQIASVALMDARSIAATAAAQGCLTSAEYTDTVFSGPTYFFDKSIYENRVYDGIDKADPVTEIKFGPGIVDWPEMSELGENLLLKVASVILDPVTTTDELIPSGETSSYRSNPLRLAEYTLSRRDPGYVERAKEIQKAERARLRSGKPEDVEKTSPKLKDVMEKVTDMFGVTLSEIEIGSVIYAVKPGDGSAREQAASCQKVLGGLANIAGEYATKRYRSNLINWGMLPFLMKEKPEFEVGDYIYIKDIKHTLKGKNSEIEAYLIRDSIEPISLRLGELTDNEREIILKGCLINYYKEQTKDLKLK